MGDARGCGPSTGTDGAVDDSDLDVRYSKPLSVSVVGKKGAIVRAGCHKSTTWVMKLLWGMEGLAVGESVEPVDGSIRVKLVEPVTGWVTLKMVKPYGECAEFGSCGGESVAKTRKGTTEMLMKRLEGRLASRAPPEDYASRVAVAWAFPGDDAAPSLEAPVAQRVSYRVAARERSNDPSDPDRLSPIFAVDGRVLSSSAAAAKLGAGAREEIGPRGAVGCSKVLSAHETATLIASVEAMGFDDARNGAVRLNDTCVVVVSQGDADELFRRVRAAVPDVVTVGGVAVGPACSVNRRWRFYKYAPADGGATPPARFLPHFDAAWPGAAIDANGVLVHDASGEHLSWFTLLVYLNDDFEGGATRLFSSTAVVDVAPASGAALVFPHGHHPDSLFHEGTPVSTGNAKLCFRTDVLFKSAFAEAEAPPEVAERG